MATEVFEVHVEKEAGDLRSVYLFAMDDDRQARFLNAEQFGPFCTALEISQWVWRQLTLDLARPLA